MFLKSVFSMLLIMLLLSKCSTSIPKAETPNLTISFVSPSQVTNLSENTSVIALGLLLLSSLAVSSKSKG